MPQPIPARVLERLEKGATNLDLMKSGIAPIGSDGYQIILHHVPSEASPASLLSISEKAPLIELEASTIPAEFRGIRNVIESQFRKDPAQSAKYCQFKSQYWRERASETDGTLR